MNELDVSSKESAKNYVVEYEDFKKESLYTKEESEAIQQKALADGCIIEPLIAWAGKNYLVWGYEELAIAQEHDLPFEVKRIEFESMADCLAWIGEKRLATPCLNGFQKTEIGLSFWEYWSGKDEAKYGAKSPLKKAALERYGRADKLAIVAIKAGISHNSVNKICRILASDNKELIEKCRKGEISIHAAYDKINCEKDDGNPVEGEGEVSADNIKIQRKKKQKQNEVDSLAKYCSAGFTATKKKLDEHGLEFFILRWNEEHPENLIYNRDVKKAIKAFETNGK